MNLTTLKAGYQSNKPNQVVGHHYMPQLDTLRAIAVILVIISHWFSAEHVFNRFTSNGTLGVTLFFVLSGFLITGILLRNKTDVQKGFSTSGAFKIFYIRRSLRIFPVYYLLLVVLVLFNIASVRESFWWHFFYASNFFFWAKGEFGGSLSHLWTLSVEEQFYLIWPAIILFIPVKNLPAAFVLGILTAIIFRFLVITPQNELGRFLMPGSLDSFCIGALFAYGRYLTTATYQRYAKSKNFLVIVAVVLLAFVHTSIYKNANWFFKPDYYFIISISFGVLIDKVADTVTYPPLGIFLNNKILQYIGKISYGIYLFHNFIPFFYGLPLPKSFEPVSLYIIQICRFGILIAIASLSWFLFEKPLLKLKDRFSFGRRQVITS